jgi:hypothetical protein
MNVKRSQSGEYIDLPRLMEAVLELRQRVARLEKIQHSKGLFRGGSCARMRRRRPAYAIGAKWRFQVVMSPDTSLRRHVSASSSQPEKRSTFGRGPTIVFPVSIRLRRAEHRRHRQDQVLARNSCVSSAHGPAPSQPR